jgi:hypothetical protein
LGLTKVGTYVSFVTMPVFTVRSCQYLALPPSWKTTRYRLSATTYSIYSQLPSILEAISLSATRGRAMSWWQGRSIMAWLKSQSTVIRHEVFGSYRHHSNIRIIKIEFFPRVLLPFSLLSLCLHCGLLRKCPSRVTWMNIPSPMRTEVARGSEPQTPRSGGGFSPEWITQQMNVRVDDISKVYELCEIWGSHSGISKLLHLLGRRRLVNTNGRFERS